MTRFAAVERVADAVLYEGYVLYPYRASAAKNRCRWQFGVIAPRPPHEEEGEPWFSRTECLIAPGAAPSSLTVRTRFLRPQLAHDEWLQGRPHAIDAEAIALNALPLRREFLFDADGAAAALVVEAEPREGFILLRLTLQNRVPWRLEFGVDRDAMLCRSLVGAHLLLALEEATFVSLLDPPIAAAPLVANLHNRHTWPILVGDRTRRDLMLSSPIVLYDYPAVAAESPGDLCDAAEIDEILSLRILTMTDEEKREARATDPRAEAILDRVEGLSPEAMSSLHGTMRSADFFNPPGTPSPEHAFVMIGAHRIEKGSRVRLRPGRRADAMDMFLRDHAATVAGVYRDVDDRTYVAVTVDADPAASLHASFGRFFYFDPAEVEPIVTPGEHP